MRQRIVRHPLSVALLIAFNLLFCSLSGHSQSANEIASAAPDSDSLPDAPQAAPTTSSTTPAPQGSTLDTGQQTKRILFIIPNFRSVSVDEKLPPMTAKEEIKLVVQDSFDYSSFIYVGIVAGIGQAENSYPDFGQGAAGYGRYYWHNMA